MADTRLFRFMAFAVVGILLVVCYLAVRSQSQNEIARVKEQVSRLQQEKDSIQAFVSANAAVQQSLQLTRDDTEAEVAVLRDYVGLLEQQRRETALTVRSIRKTSDLQSRLDAAYPEMARSNWGITTIPLEPGDTLGVEYFLIPAWFTETFIIDHQNAESWREQKTKLLAVDSLRVQVAALQDSVATLHAQNALALQAGYHNASREYRDLSRRYIAELRKPRFSLGSTVGMCLGAAGAGAVIATLTQR
ncbi:hypothetical protein ACFL3B_05335 [Gemmatimonadota bacterium]